MLDAEKWLSLSRTFTFFPFFLLGFFLEKSEIKRLFTWRIRLFSIVALIAMFVLIHFGFPDLPQEWLYGSKSYDALGVPEEDGVVGRLTIYGASTLMMISFLALVPNQRYSFSVFGTRTFYIYVLHGFILKYLHETKFPDFIMNIHGYPLLLGLSVLIILFLGSKPIVQIMRPLLELRLPKRKQAVS
ncbi:fucose 4-O-acetylase-like acetyltransferase [Saccharococcus thermophilus]|uniref:Fucose 4-O-acetylase-like acetyltransferase n=1 Tax=Saccharococcus thermophilus TaxID=29396 RepID=A0A846MD15_9BACL|nr:fucose 4-O-acetylase-like acetyltransferase [Saccharococcus thermophilus]